MSGLAWLGLAWPGRHQEEEETGAGGGEVKRTEKARCCWRVVGVRTLIMGCQTIMLIVYSALTPSVCLYVYPYRLQPSGGLSFPHLRVPLLLALVVVVVVVIVVVILLRRRKRERERKRDYPVRLLTGSLSEKEMTKTAFLKARHGGLRGGSYLSGQDKRIVELKNPSDGKNG